MLLGVGETRTGNKVRNSRLLHTIGNYVSVNLS